MSKKRFLSCLFGSSPLWPCRAMIRHFLSCLFGSSQAQAGRAGAIAFLSCLFGSSRALFPVSRRCPFLSCLFGSSLDVKSRLIVNALFEQFGFFLLPFLQRLNRRKMVERTLWNQLVVSFHIALKRHLQFSC